MPRMRQPRDRLDLGERAEMLHLQCLQRKIPGPVLTADEDGSERRLPPDGPGAEGRGATAAHRAAESAQGDVEQHDAVFALSGRGVCV